MKKILELIRVRIAQIPVSGRTAALLAGLIPLAAVFVYTGMRSGPLAPIAVTVTTVQSRAVSPALFGVGAAEARFELAQPLPDA